MPYTLNPETPKPLNPKPYLDTAWSPAPFQDAGQALKELPKDTGALWLTSKAQFRV